MEIIPSLSTLLISFAAIVSIVLLTMIVSIIFAQVMDGLFEE